jgi:GR25 family glycosyltransferase involved in LPS biosynthesis
LYHTDDKYREWWGGEPLPASPTPVVQEQVVAVTQPRSAFLINLKRRPDRLAVALKECEKAGITPIVFEAIDGKETPPPEGFTAGPGAWGCRESHRLIMRNCLESGVEEAMVLEDDVVFVDDFQARLSHFLSIVPWAWEAIFLGGQHMSPPHEALSGVFLPGKPRGIHRTHAYIVRRPYMQTLHDIFATATGHIDHAWGAQQAGRQIFAPTVWLAGQGEGKSDISNKVLKKREWQPKRWVRDALPPPPCGGCRKPKTPTNRIQGNTTMRLLLGRLKNKTLIEADRLQRIHELVGSTRHLQGAMAEVGVYKGGSAYVIADADENRPLYLYDTFSGIPESDSFGGHKAGEFGDTSVEAVSRLLSKYRNIHIKQGVFPATGVDVPYSFVHLDADTYQSTSAALDFFLPRMVPGGVIVFDDWEWINCPGVKRAIEERNLPVEVHTKQAIYRHRAPSVMTMSHAGDLGDLIYGLPTIERLCSDSGATADLVLYRSEGMVRQPWTPASVERVRSLLLQQPYIAKVRYEPTPEGTVLDVWRKKYKAKFNLTDNQLDGLGLPRHDHSAGWLRNIEAKQVAPIVFHRSPRYRSVLFPWKQIVKEAAGKAVMVGSVDEHADFVRLFGDIPYRPTPTLLELAEVIAGCSLFVGNQSAPLAVANGLCKDVVIELPLRPRNTVFRREGCFTSFEQAVRKWKAIAS